MLGRREPEIEAGRASTRVGSAGSPVRVTPAVANRLEAFNSFYDDHAAAVHASARLMCGLARADEVTRDVFVSAWSRPGWLDPSNDMVRTQVVVAVYRHAADRLRPALVVRRGVNSRREISLLRGSQRAASRAAMLNDALDGDLLSDRERCALALTLIGNCSTHEVARLLNDSEDNTAQMLTSAMRRLSRASASGSN